ncbi:MAG: hypothetical protein M3159_07065 [Actinomycetota bacterium]|nr:hypothetical protein [Actinomycetota bacterium]
MTVRARVLRIGVTAAAIALLAGACADDSTPVASGGSTSSSTSVPADSSQTPSKVPPSVSDVAGRVAADRQSGSADLSGSSTAFLHVRPDGKIELVLRSADPITADRQAALTGLGVDVVGTVGANSVQVWVPADKVDDVGALPWVASVSPPSYSRVGG